MISPKDSIKIVIFMYPNQKEDILSFLYCLNVKCGYFYVFIIGISKLIVGCPISAFLKLVLPVKLKLVFITVLKFSL